MTISAKIIIPFMFLLAILVAVFTYLLVYTNRSQQLIDHQISDARKVTELTTELAQLRAQSQLSLFSYRFNNNDTNLAVIARNRTINDHLIAALHTYIKTETGKELLAGFEKSRPPLQDARARFIRAMQSGDEQLMKKAYYIWQIQADYSGASLQDLINYNFLSVQRSELMYKDLSLRIVLLTISVAIFMIIFIILLFFYIRSILTVPIREISFAARMIAAGDFDTRLTIHSRDELGQLAGNLNSMADKLKQYYKNLQNEVRRKEAEIRRNKAFEAQKDDFMSIASHELRTPVTSLKVFAQLLYKQAEKEQDSGYLRYLHKMDEQINKLSNLITDLLDITRIQSGKMPLNMKLFDLNTCLADIAEVSNQLHKNHTILISGKARQRVYGDEDRIVQVFNNLISNAIKYSPGAENVRIFIANHRDSVTVSVQDFGIGIDKKEQKKIFDRFYRVTKKDEATFPGLGIGLYISAEIIKRHGGTINVKSEKNKGSVFSVTLPFQPAKIR